MAVGVNTHPGARLQLVDVFEKRLICHRILEGQVRQHGVFVHFLHKGRMRQKALDFRAKEKRAVIRRLAIIQRLDAEHIPRQKEAVRFRVPDGEGKHPTHAVEDALAPFGVAVHQNLAVSVTLEMIAFLLELGTDLLVIIDLTVKHQRVTAAFIVQRLIAGVRQVDDRQTAKAQHSTLGHMVAAAVRSAMTDRVHHLLDQRFVVVCPVCAR